MEVNNRRSLIARKASRESDVEAKFHQERSKQPGEMWIQSHRWKNQHHDPVAGKS